MAVTIKLSILAVLVGPYCKTPACILSTGCDSHSPNWKNVLFFCSHRSVYLHQCNATHAGKLFRRKWILQHRLRQADRLICITVGNRASWNYVGQILYYTLESSLFSSCVSFLYKTCSLTVMSNCFKILTCSFYEVCRGELFSRLFNCLFYVFLCLFSVFIEFMWAVCLSY